MAARRDVLLPTRDDPAGFAARAAELGYDRLWTGELWGGDAFVTLGRAAEARADIGLGTAIVNVFSRTPATLALGAATVADATRGDVVLGLGTSTRRGVETLHGLTFDRPVRRLHETVELAGNLLAADEPVEYDGELVGAHGAPGFGVDVPVYTAALGEAARRATGRVADGWLPHNVPFDHLAEAFDTVAAAARERGRDPGDIAVTPYVPCAVDADPAVARDAIRAHLAYYVGSGAGYRRAVATAFPDAAAAIAADWQAGDRDAARARVTDEMVDALSASGTPAAARERLARLAEREVVDAVAVVVPGNAPELADATVEALAPANS